MNQTEKIMYMPCLVTNSQYFIFVKIFMYSCGYTGLNLDITTLPFPAPVDMISLVSTDYILSVPRYFSIPGICPVSKALHNFLEHAPFLVKESANISNAGTQDVLSISPFDTHSCSSAVSSRIRLS